MRRADLTFAMNSSTTTVASNANAGAFFNLMITFVMRSAMRILIYPFGIVKHTQGINTEGSVYKLHCQILAAMHGTCSMTTDAPLHIGQRPSAGACHRCMHLTHACLTNSRKGFAATAALCTSNCVAPAMDPLHG